MVPVLPVRISLRWGCGRLNIRLRWGCGRLWSLFRRYRLAGATRATFRGWGWFCDRFRGVVLGIYRRVKGLLRSRRGRRLDRFCFLVIAIRPLSLRFNEIGDFDVWIDG
jgi:hypothetical protein